MGNCSACGEGLCSIEMSVRWESVVSRLEGGEGQTNTPILQRDQPWARGGHSHSGCSKETRGAGACVWGEDLGGGVGRGDGRVGRGGRPL